MVERTFLLFDLLCGSENSWGENLITEIHTLNTSKHTAKGDNQQEFRDSSLQAVSHQFSLVRALKH